MSTYASFIADFEPLRSMLGAVIAVGYTALGTPLAHPARMVTINNLTNADLLLSINPPTDQVVIPAGTGKVYDITSNTFNTNLTGIFAFPQGTQFYVKQLEVPSNGKSIYIEVVYGDVRQ